MEPLGEQWAFQRDARNALRAEGLGKNAQLTAELLVAAMVRHEHTVPPLPFGGRKPHPRGVSQPARKPVNLSEALDFRPQVDLLRQIGGECGCF